MTPGETPSGTVAPKQAAGAGESGVLPEVVDLTRELVAIDSQNPGGTEQAIAGYLRDLARACGFEVRVVEPVPGRPNLLITADKGGRGVLTLAGHLDTKPIGDGLARWHTPPLELTIADGFAYGLGTSDMKGAVAAMLHALVDWAGSAGSGRLNLLLTADEEAGCEAGAKALATGGHIAGLGPILIGEPSGLKRDWEALYPTSRGMACFDVVIETAQGHSGLSERLPTSATVAASLVLLALRDLDVDPPGSEFSSTVNPGVAIEGGVFFGVHPGHARVSCDIRTVPGADRETIHRAVQERVAGAVPEDVSWQVRFREDLLGWMEPGGIAVDHPLVTVAAGVMRDRLGREPELAAYPGGTDANAFWQFAGIPAIASMGPGRLTVAHGPNECISLDSLRVAPGLYAEVACRYLALPEA